MVSAKGYVEEIIRQGGSYTLKSDRCNVYVRAEKDEGGRFKNALAAGAEIVGKEAFTSLIAQKTPIEEGV